MALAQTVLERLAAVSSAEDVVRFNHLGKGAGVLEGLRAALMQARRTALRPPPRMTVVEWAETYRKLSKEGSSQGGGRWVTSRVEVARGPMLSVTERGVKEITVEVCTQLLKTELINNVLGYFIHLDPAPMLLVQPKKELGESWSKERLMPMVRDTQGPDGDRVLARLLSSSDTGESTILAKKFPGGSLTIVGSNSPTDVAARPIARLFCDETDKYPPSAGIEGDPISLGKERLATFPSQALAILACSPTDAATSRIHMSYLQSDQRRPFVACPHCQHSQVLEWENVKWQTDGMGIERSDTARYCCEKCGQPWEEHQRLVALRTTTRWRQTRPFLCCGVEQQPLKTRHWDEEGRALCEVCDQRAVSNEHAGFNCSKLYSPWEPITALVKKWLVQRQDPSTKKVFWNTQLARVWEENSEAMDTTGLKKRRESYAARVPAGVSLLTAGVDGQKDRLEVEVVGWGYGEESWGIAHFVLLGDPSGPEPWDKLDALLKRTYDTEDGRRLIVQATCVDTGGLNADTATRWCNARSGRRVWACFGLPERGGTLANIFPSKASYRNRQKLAKFGLGTQAAKNMLYSRLGIANPGPGYMHWPDNTAELWADETQLTPAGYDDEYFSQFTSEHRVLKAVAGVLRSSWEKKKADARNETWDIRVYALAALRGLELHGVPVKRKLDEFAPPPPDQEASSSTPPKPKPPTQQARNRVRWRIGR